MHRGTPTALAAVAALAVLGGVWLFRSDGAGQGEAERSGTVLQPNAPTVEARGDAATFDAGPSAVPLSAADAGLPAPTAASATPPAPATLLGHVVRAADATPVAGLAVDALVDALTLSGVTAEDGSYHISVTAGLVVHAVVAHSGPDTVGCRREVQRRLSAGEQFMQDLQVGRGGRLSGWVVDERGAGVPRADVLGCNTDLWSLTPEQFAHPDRSTTANDAGEFTLAGLGPSFTLTARAPGLTAYKLLSGSIGEGASIGGPGWSGGAGGIAGPAATEPDQPGALTVVLTPAHTIRGRVIDGREQAVAGAEMTLQLVWNLLAPNFTAAAEISRGPPPSRKLHTDATGAFAFEDCCNKFFELTVSHDGLVGWNGTVSPDEPELLIRLDGGASLSGTVVAAESGAPLAGASVRIRAGSGDRDTPSGGATDTDAQGSFAVGALLPTNRATVAVLATGRAVQVLQPVTVDERGNPPLRIELEREHVLAGLVVDGSGAPVADVPIEIEGDRLVDLNGTRTYPAPTWERRFKGLDRTVTDVEGRFRLGQLYDGEFKLRAVHPLDSNIVATTTVHSGTSDLRIVLDANAPHGVVLVGTVRDALTRQPITSFSVTPHVRGADGELIGVPHAVENPQGAFRITGLESGKILLQVSAPGYMLRTFGEQEYAEGEHRVDADLAEMRSLEVHVLDRQRRPVSAQLSFTDEDGNLLWVYPGVGIGTQHVSTDASGWAIFKNLPAARLTAHVQLGWLGTPQDFPLDLRGAPNGPVEFVLDRCRPVKLRVLVIGGTQPLAESLQPGDPAQCAAAVQAAFAQGATWRPEAPVRVRALAADGRVLVQGELDLGDVHAASGAELPEVMAPQVAAITVPEEPLTLEFSANGCRSTNLAWTPAGSAGPSSGQDSAETGNLLFVVLTRG